MRWCFALYIWRADASKMATTDTARTFSQQLFPHLLPTASCTFQVRLQGLSGLASIFPPSSSQSITVLGKCCARWHCICFTDFSSPTLPSIDLNMHIQRDWYLYFFTSRKRLSSVDKYQGRNLTVITEVQYFCIKKSSILQLDFPFSTSLPSSSCSCQHIC